MLTNTLQGYIKQQIQDLEFSQTVDSSQACRSCHSGTTPDSKIQSFIQKLLAVVVILSISAFLAYLTMISSQPINAVNANDTMPDGKVALPK